MGVQFRLEKQPFTDHHGSRDMKVWFPLQFARGSCDKKVWFPLQLTRGSFDKKVWFPLQLVRGSPATLHHTIESLTCGPNPTRQLQGSIAEEFFPKVLGYQHGNIGLKEGRTLDREHSFDSFNQSCGIYSHIQLIIYRNMYKQQQFTFHIFTHTFATFCRKFYDNIGALTPHSLGSQFQYKGKTKESSEWFCFFVKELLCYSGPVGCTCGTHVF